jgi:hypothetical protein
VVCDVWLLMRFVCCVCWCVWSGLEATVMDMLRNYQPASLEKLPFYCRICRFQGAR